MTSKSKYRWEWFSSKVNSKTNKFEDDEWSIYDDNIQNLLNNALSKKPDVVDFDINGTKFEISLGNKAVQRNTKTGFERPIRLCIFSLTNNDEDDDDEQDKKEGWYYWQWMDDNKHWITYSPYHSILLENKYKEFVSDSDANSSFKLQLGTTSYKIDFKQMSQINERTKYPRKVKRELSDLTNVKEENSEEAKATTSAAAKKRKALSENDKKLSTSSTISISSNQSDDNDKSSEPKSKNKKLKKIRDIAKEIKEENIENEDENVKTEPVEEEDEVVEAKPSKRKATKSSAKKEEQEDEDEDETKSKKLKSGKGKVKKSEPVEEEEKIKTIEFTGEVPLDEVFIEMHGKNYRVYQEGDDCIYDCMLNQTNLQYNNNKYYLIQLLEQKGKNKSYSVWMRWGRVGKVGQKSFQTFDDDLNGAKECFENKFYDKTKNYWEDRHIFEKCPGKYDLVHKDYNEESKSDKVEEKPKVKKENTEKPPTPPSKLDKKVQDLIELICNVTEMENMLKEMKYDAKKAPLGKLSKNQIKAGYAALKKIEELINNKKTGRELLEANNEFYTRIPHDFGMRVPPLIQTPQSLKEKIKLLEALEDIEVAVKMLNQESEIENPIDRHYDQLECIIKPMDHNDDRFKLIETYLHKTHAPTHNNYKLKLLDVFECEKEAEKSRFKDWGNRMLLWHGSRLTNWAGILSQGLRIAPKEAPVTGYMFGKGCYFADCSSKSANYCYATSNKNISLLSLSEVSLGVFNELKEADYDADKLPKGKHSTKGIGRNETDPKEWVTLDDGCVVPVGKLKSKVDPKNASSYSLLYNEYIVYDVSQIKLRYLIKVEFEFDD